MELVSLLTGIIVGAVGIGVSIFLYWKTTQASGRLETATLGIETSVQRLLQTVQVFEDVYQKLILAEQVNDPRRLCLYLVASAARDGQQLVLEDILVTAELRGWGELKIRETIGELRAEGLIEVDPRPQRTSIIAPSRRLLAIADAKRPTPSTRE